MIATADVEKRREEFDALIQACASKPKWSNDDRKKLRALRRSLGTPTVIAPALGISTATLHWWERQVGEGKEELQPPPPIDILRKLESFISPSVSISESTAEASRSVKLESNNGIAIARRTAEVLERAKYARKSWIMRSGTPFVVLRDANMLDAMIRSLSRENFVSYFVYRAPSKEANSHVQIFLAMATYEELRKKLAKSPAASTVLGRIQGIPVTDENDANKLGLVDFWTSYCMIEYNEEGLALFERPFDVWQEFVINESDAPDVQKSRLVWLELPTEHAKEWRRSRIALLKKLERQAEKKPQK